MSEETLGEKLQKRARELGLTDAEVARRVGLGQSRYANYIAGTREPDFGTLAKICRVLDITPNVLLAFEPWPELGEEEAALIQRLQATIRVLDLRSLRTAAMVVDALAVNQGGDASQTG